MTKYVCSICGYTYDDEKTAHGVRWDDLPAAWVCPTCRAGKSAFKILGQPEKKTVPASETTAASPPGVLTPREMSIICSSLENSCRKQYLLEEAGLFAQLSEYYMNGAKQAVSPSFQQIHTSISKDINDLFPAAKAAATASKDRGALRSLVWGEKVSRMLDSILSRYEEEGETMLEHNIYVCSACGFVSVGDQPPTLCPVCSVPAWKFEKVEDE